MDTKLVVFGKNYLYEGQRLVFNYADDTLEFYLEELSELDEDQTIREYFNLPSVDKVPCTSEASWEDFDVIPPSEIPVTDEESKRFLKERIWESLNVHDPYVEFDKLKEDGTILLLSCDYLGGASPDIRVEVPIEDIPFDISITPTLTDITIPEDWLSLDFKNECLKYIRGARFVINKKTKDFGLIYREGDT